MPMLPRNRARGFTLSSEQYGGFQHYCEGGLTNVWWTAGSPTGIEHTGESMTDYIGTRRPWPFKPCIHDEWECVLGDARDVAYCHRGPIHVDKYSTYSHMNYLGLPGYLNNSSISRALFPTPEITEDDKYRLTRVWETEIIPSIKSDLDLLVFLAELDDLAKLVRSLAGKIRWLFSSGDAAVQQMLKKPYSIRVSLDKTATSISNEWLEYNFALAPTVSDLIGILKGLLTFRKQMDDLIKGQGKLHKRHGGFTGKTPEIGSKKFFECPGFPNRCDGNCIYTNAPDLRQACLDLRPSGMETCRYGITVLYRYSLPGWVNTLCGDISALFSSLGLKPGLDTVWELIPFSFVVDWFLPIGDWISKVKLDPFPVKTELLDVCFSVKSKLAAQLYGKLGCGDTMRLIATMRREYYQRVVGPEILVRTPHFKWPSWLQLSLGAALIKVRKRKGKRP